MRHLAIIGTTVLSLSSPAFAQEEGSRLERFLESSLSDENRIVDVTGLSGALSSEATIEKLTVADQEGVWLTLENAVLNWNRLALARGELSVNTLKAGKISVTRKPLPSDTIDLPDPEAKPFSLPELPVSIDIDELAADHVEIAEAVAGTAASLKVLGALELSGGELDTQLTIDRLDRPGDGLTLSASFANATRHLALDLSLKETAGGLVATMAGLPDRPPLSLTVAGDGPIDKFKADVALATEGIDRIGGTVTLSRETPEAPLVFAAALDGDIRPLFQPDYQVFFGPSASLEALGQRHSDGRLTVERAQLRAEALSLLGSLDIAAGGGVTSGVLQAAILPPTGETVLLPLPGPRTSVEAVRLTFGIDEDGAWGANGVLRGLDRPDLRISDLTLQGRGLRAEDGSGRGELGAKVEGLWLSDPALAKAAGETLEFDTPFRREPDGELTFDALRLEGAGLDLLGSLIVTGIGLEGDLRLSADARLRAEDFERFSGVAGRPLTGAGRIALKGWAEPLSGSFDAELNATTLNLTVDIPQADTLLAGESRVSIDARRDETGLTLRHFAADAEGVSAQASGVLRKVGSSLEATARLEDIGVLAEEVSGPATLEAKLRDVDGQYLANVSLRGPNESRLTADGTLKPGGDADIRFDASLKRLERFVAGLTGAVTATGDAKRRNGIWNATAEAQGPAEMRANIQAMYDETDGNMDASAEGLVQLAAANRLIAPASINGPARFDLKFSGTPSLENLAGQITLSGVDMAMPRARTRLVPIDGTVTLNGGSALVNVGARVENGGNLRLEGPISMTPPFNSALAVSLNGIVMTDGRVYETLVDGSLRHDGPLAGGGRVTGQIEIGRTELNIAAASGAAGAPPIPEMIHRAEPAAARATRARAGLLQTESADPSRPVALDIGLNAPNQIFVRGRGLDAELGGQLQISGTTARVVPFGGVELIRGNLDILGRRLELTSGRVTLQGAFDPAIDFTATTTTEDGSASLEISGTVSDPEIDITSSPPRPEEEALGMLVFGGRMHNLSPLAAAQLAASLAQLRGGSGGGLTGTARETLGVDTLDVTTDAEGNAQVGAGRYLSENIYSDVTVNSQGRTQVNLNLDLNDNFTARGRVDSTGENGLGLFFTRDY